MWNFSPVFFGVAAFILTLGVRAATANRIIRSKLRLSLIALAVYAGLSLVIVMGWGGSGVASNLRSVGQIVLTFGLVNFLVAVAINPFRVDRVPEHFPNIVQDTIIIGVFLVVATFVEQEKLLTTSAVGAVVIGFALQDTLGNTFAGLAIQVEKPFRVGHWISAGNFEGLVTEITWRATKLTTKTGNLVVVPNNVIAKDAIVNFSQPAAPTRLQIEMGVGYEVAPNDVKSAIKQAVTGLPAIASTPAPEVLLVDFGSSAVVYRVRFWITDYARDETARDQVRTAIYYALRRAGMEIPYPMQVQFQREEPPARTAEQGQALERVLAAVDVFAPMAAGDRAELVASSSERLYGESEVIVRQDQAGDSMFVICRGQVQVTLEPSGQKVATIGEGGYFGEMSLLTGDARTATVSAMTDCSLLEITATAFRRLAMDHPAVIEQIGLAVAERREGLERSRLAAAAPVAAPEVAHRSFLARIQRFLRLPGIT